MVEQLGGTGDPIADFVVYLSAREEDLTRFFAATGYDPTALRAGLSDLDVRAGILDYLVSSEPLLLAFCEETGHRPEAIAADGARNGGWM
ncbi:MAG: DUF3572 family protein [Devosiaceae bacterium]|nr:DUF3572 family protein [Devosiaceae bacterium MH13]